MRTDVNKGQPRKYLKIVEKTTEQSICQKASESESWCEGYPLEGLTQKGSPISLKIQHLWFLKVTNELPRPIRIFKL